MRLTEAPAVEHNLVPGFELKMSRGLNDPSEIDAWDHRPAAHHRRLARNRQPILVIDRGVRHPDGDVAFHQIRLCELAPGSVLPAFAFGQKERFEFFRHG